MKRLHRLRATPARRAVFGDVRLDASMFCLPLFAHNESEPLPIASLPGVARLPIADCARAAKDALASGVHSLLVFGIPSAKDADGAGAADPNGPAMRAIDAIKQACGDDIVVLADTCLCSYTEDGHCARFADDGSIDLPQTLDRLSAAAVTQARAGADLVAPSDMMDGRIAAIRGALDTAGCEMTGVLSYAAKYASSFYGPFRDAADSTPAHGDRRGYQIDPASRRQGLASLQRDLDEGADAVMVKPALPYLDVIAEARARIDVPLWAYQVSGEYAMLRSGVVEPKAATLEALTAIARAGADTIVTYAAVEAATWLAESQ